MQFESPDHGEDMARADLYGLLANLFYAPPSGDLLAVLRSAGAEGEGVLGQAWQGLIQAARNADAEALREEYDDLFIGTGKPEILLYGSYYLSGFLMEKPLAVLRSDLQELGLERAEHMSETEDHIASLCEVMRYLIASDDVLVANLVQQKQFFAAHMAGWVIQMCDAIIAHPRASFYVQLAQLAKIFFEVEMQAMEMQAMEME